LRAGPGRRVMVKGIQVEGMRGGQAVYKQAGAGIYITGRAKENANGRQVVVFAVARHSSHTRGVV